MDFIRMRDKLIAHFDEMTKDATHLFEVELDKDALWNLYLDSFPAGTACTVLGKWMYDNTKYDPNVFDQFEFIELGD